MRHIPVTVLLAAGLAAGAAFAQTEQATPLADAATASVSIKGADGAEHGTVTLTQTNAGVLLSAQLTGLPPGPHGFHFHETGKCEPPFETAGGHYNPTSAKHGYLVENGPHVGDIPNLLVPDSGNASVEILNPFVSLADNSGNTLFDADGSALVLHAGADDYQSQPSGKSGDRIACGVVEKGS
jgi:Cu-Zn family superoxide dismutase